MEDPNYFENASDEVKEQLDSDFKETMVHVFEGLEEKNHITVYDLEAISHILLDTIELVAPSVEAEDSDAE